MEPETWGQLTHHEQYILTEAHGQAMPPGLTLDDARKFVANIDEQRKEPFDVLHFE